MLPDHFTHAVTTWRHAGIIGLLLVLILTSGCRSRNDDAPLPMDQGHELRLDQAEFNVTDRPRNIIFILGDGMGFGHLSALSMIRARSAITSMPVSGIVSTSSSDRIVTDSAAGASAYATGQRTRYRMLSMSGDGSTKLLTLLERMRMQGSAAGIVTTSYIIDASPAAWVAHHTQRYDRGAVARQVIGSGTELLIGGRDHLPSRARTDAADSGYHVYDLDQVPLSSIRLPALALYETGPNRVDNPDLPLASLTRRAINLLAPDPDGFFLFVEHEGTDEAAHQSDLAGLLASLRSLDDAVAVALEFARTAGDTLVIVTADHETGGVQVLESGSHRELRLELPRTRHTAEAVPIFAFGPGAHEFTGMRTNEQVGRTLAELIR